MPRPAAPASHQSLMLCQAPSRCQTMMDYQASSTLQKHSSILSTAEVHGSLLRLPVEKIKMNCSYPSMAAAASTAKPSHLPQLAMPVKTIWPCYCLNFRPRGTSCFERPSAKPFHKSCNLALTWATVAGLLRQRVLQLFGDLTFRLALD